MSSVFISYCHEDTWAMRLIAAYLRRERYEVIVDERLDTTASGWRRQIEAYILNAACVIVVMTPSAKASKWVNEEVDLAQANNRQIIPILANGDPESSVLFGIRTIQRYDIRKNYDQGLQDILREVSKYAVKLPDEAKGIDWERLGSIYWLGSDSRRLRSLLAPEEYSADKTYAFMRQIIHHAQRVNMNPLSLKRLEKLAEMIKNGDADTWAIEKRKEVEAELRSVIRVFAEKAQELDDGYDPGPMPNW